MELAFGCIYLTYIEYVNEEFINMYILKTHMLTLTDNRFVNVDVSTMKHILNPEKPVAYQMNLNFLKITLSILEVVQKFPYNTIQQ